MRESCTKIFCTKNNSLITFLNLFFSWKNYFSCKKSIRAKNIFVQSGFFLARKMLSLFMHFRYLCIFPCYQFCVQNINFWALGCYPTFSSTDFLQPFFLEKICFVQKKWSENDDFCRKMMYIFWKKENQ